MCLFHFLLRSDYPSHHLLRRSCAKRKSLILICQTKCKTVNAYCERRSIFANSCSMSTICIGVSLSSYQIRTTNLPFYPMLVTQSHLTAIQQLYDFILISYNLAYSSTILGDIRVTAIHACMRFLLHCQSTRPLSPSLFSCRIIKQMFTTLRLIIWHYILSVTYQMASLQSLNQESWLVIGLVWSMQGCIIAFINLFLVEHHYFSGKWTLNKVNQLVTMPINQIHGRKV